jgi:DNA polymerase elongation subunit (family B)
MSIHSFLAYVYTWKYNSKNGNITAYALDEENNTLRLDIEGYHPYFYLELPAHPEGLNWSNEDIKNINKDLQERVFLNHKPASTPELIQSKKLYYSVPGWFIKYRFNCNMLFGEWKKRIESKTIRIHSSLTKIKAFVNESSVSPILQYVCDSQLEMAGWVLYSGLEQTPRHFTQCQLEKTIHSGMTPIPTVFAFDEEVYSSVDGKLPQATNKSDCIFQISCIIWKKDCFTKQVLITMGNPHSIENTRIIRVADEFELITAFMSLLQSENPNIITGWNIMGFDIKYLIQRSKLYGSLATQMSRMGMSAEPCRHVETEWSSSAYGTQSYEYFDWDGRVIIDLLVYARREIKSENYKLDTIASKFIASNKNSFSVKDIFKSYRTMDPDLLTQCGTYCIQDSVLVQKLFDFFDIWVGSTEMAIVCNVAMSLLFTNGQQVKVFSQVYKFCHFNQIVIDQRFVCKEDERYQGAYVKTPVPGIYNYVVPFDFQSLYPSLIVAYNIDYSTYVIDESVSDDLCHVIEWTEEHLFDIQFCRYCDSPCIGERSDLHNKWVNQEEYEVVVNCKSCKKQMTLSGKELKGLIRKANIQFTQEKITHSYRYRFLKEPKGVLPSIITRLLTARASVRAQMKQFKKGDPMRGILHQRQLSYKTSANSMYGALGVRAGMLPFMPGAMCVTALGRQNLAKAAEHLVSRYGVNWIYSDTDSTYVQFPGIAPSDLWERAKQIEEELEREHIFRAPMALKFEEKIYDPFFILTKKRYMWQEYPKTSNVIGNKGVLLARRGSSQFIKALYEKVVQTIFATQDQNTTIEFILTQLNMCCAHCFPVSDFIITKEVHEASHYSDKRPLPAHAQLADQMRSRGERVDSGQRIEYVATMRKGVKKNALTGRIEDVEYQRRYSSILRLDYVYYIQLAMKQVDQLLHVAFGVQNMVEQQFKWRKQKQIILSELVSFFIRRIVLVEPDVLKVKVCISLNK